MKIMIPEGLSTNSKAAETDDHHNLTLIDHYENGVLITGDHNHDIQHEDNIEEDQDYIYGHDEDNKLATHNNVH
jgi:hypothetical protein